MAEPADHVTDPPQPAILTARAIIAAAEDRLARACEGVTWAQLNLLYTRDKAIYLVKQAGLAESDTDARHVLNIPAPAATPDPDAGSVKYGSPVNVTPEVLQREQDWFDAIHGGRR